MSQVVCRICLDGSNQSDMIQPCLCKGSQQYIHRECLDQWRSTNHSPDSFTTCGTCLFQYVVIEDVDTKRDQQRLMTFRLLVFRDVLLAVFSLMCIWACIGALFYWGDTKMHLPVVFKMQDYPNACYFLLGFFTFFVVVGFFGCCFAVCSESSHSSDMQCYFCYCGGNTNW
jgi:hypothetical protein